MPDPASSGGVPSPDPGHVALRPRLLVALGALAVVLAIGAALAPVVVSTPTLVWPQAGRPATSTTLALAPPRPLSFDATVPCAALAGSGPGTVEALRTAPPGDSLGLLVAAHGDGPARRITVDLDRQRLVDTPLGSTACTWAISVTAGTPPRVTRDGVPIALACGACAAVEPPYVTRLSTDRAGTPGLGVELRPDDRYDSSPSTLKTGLLVALLVVLAALVAVLIGRPRRGPPGLGARLRRRAGGLLARARAHRSPADAVVVVVSGAWAVLGPTNFDDSWYPLMARAATQTGTMANAVYMFDATEAPFVASQYLVQVWGAIGGWSLLWMRLLATILGLLAYAGLRIYTVLALRGSGVREAKVPWALLVAYLLWWMPYGLTLRPEPLIVLLSVVVLVCGQLARRWGPKGAVGAVAVAAAAASVSLMCSPTGLVAVAPLLVDAPRGWAWLRGVARERPWSAAAAVAVVVAATTVAVPVGLADASVGDILEAAAVHAWYYATVPWYDELVHYQTLLNPGVTPWARRAPVLITLAVLLVAAIASGRRDDQDPLRRLLLTSAATTGIAFALLTISPTKWVLHFPAVAASGTVLVAVALLRAALPRQERAFATAASVAILVGAAAVTFAGLNLWRPFSDRGQPFGPHAVPDLTRSEQGLLAPHLGPIFLRNPLIWIAIALLAAWWARARWMPRAPRPSPARAVLVATCLAVVVGLAGVFVLAPIRQYPGWTVALGNVHDVVHSACGLENEVSVLRPAPTPLGTPTAPVLTGDFAAAVGSPVPRDVPGLGTVWHTDAPARSGEGSLDSGWFPLPAAAGTPAPAGDPQPGATDVVVPVLASSADGAIHAGVRLEIGTGPVGAPTSVTSEKVGLSPAADERTWQEIPISLVGRPGHPTAVRVVADSPTGVLAVAQPWIGGARPVRELLDTPDGKGVPVRADQMSSALWPCVNQQIVAGGVAPPTQYRMQAGEDLGPNYTGLWTDDTLGGVWRGEELESTYVRLPTSVPVGGPATRPWGSVDVVVHDLPTGGYALEPGTTTRSGLARLPTLARESYAGIEYQGVDD
ncbi:arabinosyltransferase domain-containing protein [Actinomycetospora endophytica]|uniref:Arabinosyltransferase domain-containing protein n=1 Tax=Actinomycetospora endophytica TaxID=2291215 RepID=A0ABS8P4W0_9PSEU|nr:arabinosyltransferase domain-containing protein [Actinomycetospora endophytica]MCD2193292.1 arabinosyltransferase domain-containing protein [Actinomycetospora endophytica]